MCFGLFVFSLGLLLLRFSCLSAVSTRCYSVCVDREFCLNLTIPRLIGVYHKKTTNPKLMSRRFVVDFFTNLHMWNWIMAHSFQCCHMSCVITAMLILRTSYTTKLTSQADEFHCASGQSAECYGTCRTQLCHNLCVNLYDRNCGHSNHI